MKILYATRLFSGLQSSLAARRWQPTGVPTIFKVVEALDRSDDTPIFVFACKDQDDKWAERGDVILTIDGLHHPVHVLAGKRRFPAWLKPVAGPLREAAHAVAVARLCRRERPDLVYLDHANLFVAGFLSLVSRRPIVLRLMGIYPVMRAALTGKGLGARLMRWCYRRRYALVVCTQDGSGVEPWLDRALRDEVPRTVLLNGVDEIETAAQSDPRVAAIPSDRIVVMFLGKLDPAKGPLEFVEGFLKARRTAPGRLHALVVGTGSLAATVREKFSANDAVADLSLIERLPHDQVAAALIRSDIYVSLNRYGNLSNANLEAMRAGKAMIVPGAQPDIGIDVVTDRLLSQEGALRVPSASDTDGIAAAILRLANDRGERMRRAERVRQDANRFAFTWRERIDAEIGLLYRVACAEILPLQADLQLNSAGVTERIGR